MWSWNKEKIILSSQNSIPADLAVKQTHFMNWNAEESLLITTANISSASLYLQSKLLGG